MLDYSQLDEVDKDYVDTLIERLKRKHPGFDARREEPIRPPEGEEDNGE